jgi:hypothetical protein
MTRIMIADYRDCADDADYDRGARMTGVPDYAEIQSRHYIVAERLEEAAIGKLSLIRIGAIPVICLIRVTAGAII